MPEILAHRGNVAGPCPATENSLAAIADSLACGWGVEIDIRRRADGRFYIAHDVRHCSPAGPSDPPYAPTRGGPEPPSTTDVFALIRRYPRATVALNVKERGYERALLSCLRDAGVADQLFLFDMELIEPVAGASAAHFRALDPSVRIAARVSDRGEPVARALALDAACTVWLDEFDGPWATARDVRRLKDAGRRVYAVSPELHGRSLAEARRRWEAFATWGVDGICTDYPAALEAMLQDAVNGVLA